LRLSPGSLLTLELVRWAIPSCPAPAGSPTGSDCCRSRSPRPTGSASALGCPGVGGERPPPGGALKLGAGFLCTALADDSSNAVFFGAAVLVVSHRWTQQPGRIRFNVGCLRKTGMPEKVGQPRKVTQYTGLPRARGLPHQHHRHAQDDRGQ